MGYHEDDSVTIYCLFARFYSLWCLDRSAILQKDIRQFGSGNTGTTNTFRVLGKSAGVIVLLMDILKGTLATCFAGDLFSHNNQSSLVWCLCYSRSHVSNFCQVQRRESGGDQRRHAFRLQSNFLHLFSAYFCDLFVHNQHGQPDKYDCSLLDHFVDNPIALCRTNDFTKTKLVIDVYRNWCHLFYFLSVIVKISSGSKTAQRAVSLLVLIKE